MPWSDWKGEVKASQVEINTETSGLLYNVEREFLGLDGEWFSNQKLSIIYGSPLPRYRCFS